MLNVSNTVAEISEPDISGRDTFGKDTFGKDTFGTEISDTISPAIFAPLEIFSEMFSETSSAKLIIESLPKTIPVHNKIKTRAAMRAGFKTRIGEVGKVFFGSKTFISFFNLSISVFNFPMSFWK